MVEPPSKQLLQVLVGQKLCSERDLRGCRKRVRRLSGDLPAFDSVWLDALVQSQKLTSFQAALIDAGQLDALRIGPCVVLDRVGGCVSETFLARDAASSSLIVVKRMTVPAELKPETLTRLQRLTEIGRELTHPGLVIPHACSEIGPSRTSKSKATGSNGMRWQGARIELAVASRQVDGMTLGELMLRRGRFPAAAVTEIARQILDALNALHERGLVHGELGLQNARLHRTGQVILVDAGVTAALHPELQLNAFVRPDRYDGVAPELIGTGLFQSPRSDLYALGALLWQLLAGRPPFPIGDPLQKLAAHQSTRLMDVRELAPDTPDLLARAIQWMTEPDPQQRPATAKDVLLGVPANKLAETHETKPGRRASKDASKVNGTRSPVTANYDRLQLGAPRRSGRAALARFAESFQQPPLRRLPKPRSAFPLVMAAATAVVLLAAVTVVGLHGRTRNLVLAEMSRFGVPLPASANGIDADNTTAVTEVAVDPAPKLEVLPKPDAYGLIELDAGASYRAQKLIWQGQRLTLKGTLGSPARIVVSDESLWLRACEVVLENVCVEMGTESEGRSSPGQLAVVESQDLRIQHCRFHSPRSREVSTPASGSATEIDEAGPTAAPTLGDAFAWVPHNPQEPLRRRLNIADSQFVGRCSSIHISGAGRDHEVLLDNVLKADGGPLFVIEPHHAKTRAVMSLTLNQSTLRACDGVVALKLRDGKLDSQISLALNDCVLALRSPQESAVKPILAFIDSSNRLSRDWAEHISVKGVGSITSPGLTRFASSNLDRSIVKNLDAIGPKVSGVMAAGFTFRGQDWFAVEDSLLDEFLASRHSSVEPGIHVDTNTSEAGSP